MEHYIRKLGLGDERERGGETLLPQHKRKEGRNGKSQETLVSNVTFSSVSEGSSLSSCKSLAEFVPGNTAHTFLLAWTQ